MYGWLWRALPGPVGVKVVLALLLAAALVAVCFLWVFPAAAPYVPFNDGTVESRGAATSAGGAG